jgi:hypothetical protein
LAGAAAGFVPGLTLAFALAFALTLALCLTPVFFAAGFFVAGFLAAGCFVRLLSDVGRGSVSFQIAGSNRMRC